MKKKIKQRINTHDRNGKKKILKAGEILREKIRKQFIFTFFFFFFKESRRFMPNNKECLKNEANGDDYLSVKEVVKMNVKETNPKKGLYIYIYIYINLN